MMPRHCVRDDDTIKVMVRVRPPDTPGEDSCFTISSENSTISVPSKNDPKTFTYDSVACTDTTQDEVFSYSGKVLVDQCVSGYNGALFAYGQTGSGKTFTMMGPGFDESSESLKNISRGVIPRSLEYLFAKINNETTTNEDTKTFLVKTTFLEIYNEQIYDLLEPSQKPLQLRESLKKGVFVDGLSEKSVSSPNEAFETLMCGMANRRVASTTMNRESSRSHAVFTLLLESKEIKDGLLNVKTSSLHLVDLAGSERQKETKTEGIRLKEAGSINRSLTTLGKVIMALVDVSNGKRRFIHYRDSKLTFMLRDSLGGNSKTFVIACIHPGTRYCGESLSTLQFACHVKLIKNKAVVNEDVQGNVAKLKQEILHLKAELVRLTEVQGVPGELPAVGSAAKKLETVNVEQEAKWRKCFLDAMALWKTLSIKHQGVSQQLRTANDLNAQQEKLIRARELVLKFRDSTIQRLSGKTTTNIDVKAGEASKLREEIEELAKVEGCTPLKYLQENQRLRQALEESKVHLKEEARYQKEKADSLKEEYRVLIEEGAVEEAFSFLKDAAIKTETSKAQEQQVELQKTNHDLRCQLSELEELRRKEKLELTSQIAALKKTIEENERLRLSRLLRTSVERESLNDRHMRTLRTLTPSRPRGLGRSRLVSSPAIPPPLGGSPNGGILESTPPQESTVAVLSMELREEQERSSNYCSELEQCQQEMGKLQAEKAKIQYTAEQLQTDLDAALAKFKRKEFELESLEEDLRFYQSKAADGQILLESADREIAAARTRVKEVELENARALELLGRTEHRLDTASIELEEALTEKDGLRAENEDLRTSVAVFEMRASELEAQLEHSRNQLTTVSRQTDEERDNLELCLAEKSVALEKALTSNSSLKEHMAQIERAREEDLNIVGQEIQRLSSERERLSRALLEELSRSQEAAELCAQRSTLADERLTSLTEVSKELGISKSECSRLEALLRDTTSEVVSLQSDIERHDVEKSQLQDELGKRVQENRELSITLEQRELQLLDVQKMTKITKDNEAQELVRLQCELGSRESRIQQLVENNASLENIISDKNKELQDLVQSLEDANRSRRSLEEDLRVSHRVCDESKSTMFSYRENMKRVSSYLTAKRHEYDQVVDEKKDLETRFSIICRQRSHFEKLLERKESDIARFQESLDEARQLANCHQAESEKLRLEIKSYEARIQQVENEKEELLLLMPQAGHMNQKQKIHYIDHLRDEVLTLKQRNDALSQEVLVLNGRLRNYEPTNSRYLRESDRQNQPS